MRKLEMEARRRNLRVVRIEDGGGAYKIRMDSSNDVHILHQRGREALKHWLRKLGMSNNLPSKGI